MPIKHFLTLWTPDGSQFLDHLGDFMSLNCVLAEGNIGTLSVTIPGTHDYTGFRRDGRIAFYRIPTAEFVSGQPELQLVGNTVWLIVDRKRTIDADRRETIQIFCVHPNDLLTRRVVAYSEGSAEADKSGAADDLMKAYVRENFTATGDTARNWSSSLFAVANDTTAAPTVTKAASYRTVLTVCQELAAAAATAGTYANFEVYGTETGPFTFRTYIGQRGADQSSTSGQPLSISVTMGEFGAVELEENWADIATYVYGGGAGKKDERIVTAAWDTALINGSPYGRIEYFQDAGGTDDGAVTTTAAEQALRERRPRILFTGAVKDTEAATFGEEYNWGDRVVGEYARPDPIAQGFTDFQQYDCRVDPVRISVQRSEDPETGEFIEQETLDIRLRSES